MSFRDAGHLVRIVLWAFAMPVLKRRLSLPRLVILMQKPAQKRAGKSSSGKRAAHLVWAVYRKLGFVLSHNCLERSLVTYRVLCELNEDPELLIGLGKEGGSVVGHSWVMLDEQPFGETSELIQKFTPAARFNSSGALVKE